MRLPTITCLLTFGLLTQPAQAPASRASTVTCQSTKQDPAPVNLRFGVYTSERATTLYRQFTPFLEHVERALEARLQRPVSIELQIFKTYEDGNDALVKGQVDFVRFGPASYVLCKDKNPGVELIAMETNGGERQRPAVMIVRSNSKIRDIADLRGCRFAFGDDRSTIGRYFVQSVLLRKGIHEEDLGTIKHMGRHDKIAAAIESDECDAGCINAPVAEEGLRKGTLRVIGTYPVPNKPLVARAGLDPEIVSTLRQVLLETREKSALAELKLTGFLPVSDKDYERVREDMRVAERFSRTAASQPVGPAPGSGR